MLGDIQIILISQISATCTLVSTAIMDAWQTDLNDSFNANLWQHIWGSVYKALWETRLQQIQVNILTRTCCSHPIRSKKHSGKAEYKASITLHSLGLDPFFP